MHKYMICTLCIFLNAILYCTWLLSRDVWWQGLRELERGHPTSIGGIVSKGYEEFQPDWRDAEDTESENKGGTGKPRFPWNLVLFGI